MTDMNKIEELEVLGDKIDALERQLEVTRLACENVYSTLTLEEKALHAHREVARAMKELDNA